MSENDDTMRMEFTTLQKDLTEKIGANKINYELGYLTSLLQKSTTLDEYRLRILSLNHVFHNRSWPYLSNIDAGSGFWTFFGLHHDYLQFCQSVYDRFYNERSVSNLMMGVQKLLASCEGHEQIPFSVLGALVVLLTGKPIIDSERFNHPHVAQLTMILFAKRTIQGIYFYDTTMHDLLGKCQNAAAGDINEDEIKTCLHTSKDDDLIEPCRDVLLEHISDLSVQSTWTEFELSLLKHVCKIIPTKTMNDLEAVKMLKKAQKDDIHLPDNYIGSIIEQDKALIEREADSADALNKIPESSTMTSLATTKEITLYTYHAEIADMYWTRTYLAMKYNENELNDYNDTQASNNVPDLKTKIEELNRLLQQASESSGEQMQQDTQSSDQSFTPIAVSIIDTAQPVVEENSQPMQYEAEPSSSILAMPPAIESTTAQMQDQGITNIKFEFPSFKSIIIKRYSLHQS